MKKIPILLLLAIAAKLSFAQVIITVQVIPPYSTYLTDYVNNSNKILITLLSPGVSQDIKLTAEFTGDNGVSIITNPGYAPNAPLHLDADVLKMISGLDLKTYLDMSHVTVTGIDANDLYQGTGLPEGNYTLCIQAFDYASGVPVSDPTPMGCSNPFQIQYIVPPITISPDCSDPIEPKTPQNIVFTWLPSPGAPLTTKYKFKMVQLIPPDRNPNEAMNSATTPAFFETTISSLSFVYGPAQPALLTGQRYAWRVTAYDGVSDMGGQGAHFLNNGHSEVCSFTYANEGMTTVTPLLDNHSKIHLEFPPDKSTLQKQPLYDYMTYEFRWKGNPSWGYGLQFAELKSGQTPLQAFVQNPIINKSGKEISDGGLIFHFSNMDYALTPGKTYAWRVQSQASEYSAETWSFNVPITAADTLKISQFTINGFKVMVESIDNANPEYFAGKGYMYLVPFDATSKATVNFGQLSLKNKSFDAKTGPGDWECVYGTVNGEIVNPKPVVLTNQEGAEGNFTLRGTKIHFYALKTSQLDPGGKFYKITGASPTEEKAEMLSKVKWETSLIQKLPQGNPSGESFLFEGANSLSNNSGQVSIISTENYVTLNPDGSFKGTLQKTAMTEYNLVYPENFYLLLNGVQFDINGLNVSCGIGGSVRIPDGRPDINKDLTIDFSWKKNFHFGVKMNSFNIPLQVADPNSFAGKITSDMTFDSVEVYLIPGGGLFIPKLFVTMHFPNQNIGVTFFKGANFGEGYKCVGEGEGGTYIINTFKTSCQFVEIDIQESLLKSFTLNGGIQIPFLNEVGKFGYTVDENGFGSGGAWFGDGEFLIYADPNTKDTLVVSSYGAQLLDDRIVLDADFSFSNPNGNSVNMKQIHAKKMYISGSGFIGWQDVNSNYKNLENVQSGEFSGFQYKVKQLALSYEGDKKYKIILVGDLVLESKSLAPTNAYSVTFAFATPQPDPLPDEGRLTASIDSGGPEGIYFNNENGVTVSPGTAGAEFHDGNMDFAATFNYYHDDLVYGNGFKSSWKVGIKRPMYKEIGSTILVGRSLGYNYWFVSALYNDAAGIPTGILDVVVYGFEGRFYYNMNHKAGSQNITDDTYFPQKGTGIGLFALTKIKTGTSNGGVLWATGAMEIQTGNYDAKFYVHANLLNVAGVGSTASLLEGEGTLTWSFSPFYLLGHLKINQPIFKVFKINAVADATFYIDPTLIKVGVGVNAGIDFLGINANIKVGASMGPDLFCNLTSSFHAGLNPVNKDMGVCTAHISLDLDAVLNGKFFLNVPTAISGSGGLTASAGCGVISGSIGVNGSFIIPNPLCFAIGVDIPVPYPWICCGCKWCVCPYPCIKAENVSVGFRWHSGNFPPFSFSSGCN